MSVMTAWTIAPAAPGGLALREVAAPEPAPHEVLVDVDAFAPNPGDLAAVADGAEGDVPGWDGVGRVVRASADGSGPPEGSRVVFLGATGGWAQRRAVPSALVAVAPDGAPAEQLATVPVPVTSALRAVRRLGSLLGKRLLVVGASSAVGRAAVQLGTRAGAEVVAVARSAGAHAELRRLGAVEVHFQVSAVHPRVQGALDMVGGPHLVAAYAALDAGGTVIALGHAADQEEHFPPGAFLGDGGAHDRTIATFFLGREPDLAPDLAWCAGEVAAGRLDPGPFDVQPWTEVASWIAAGAQRPRGRVVFRVV